MGLTRAATLLAAAVLLPAAALAACGGSGEADGGQAEAAAKPTEIVDISGTEPVGQKLAGSVAPLVQCRDYNEASETEKLATIDDVRSQINLLDSGISAPALTDEEALGYFDDVCKPAWAQGLRLYKLYARAAGWVTLKRELEEAAAE